MIALLLSCLVPGEPAVAALSCPAELGFAAERRCPEEDPASCCLGASGEVTEADATCLADALGFGPGPGGRFVEHDEAGGRWTLVSVGEPTCEGEVGLAEGCGLVLDAATGEVVSEGAVVWSVTCEQRS